MFNDSIPCLVSVLVTFGWQCHFVLHLGPMQNISKTKGQNVMKSGIDIYSMVPSRWFLIILVTPDLLCSATIKLIPITFTLSAWQSSMETAWLDFHDVCSLAKRKLETDPVAEWFEPTLIFIWVKESTFIRLYYTHLMCTSHDYLILALQAAH